MKIRLTAVLSLLLVGALLGVLGIRSSRVQAQDGGSPGGFPDLVKGLKEIEGCLGVETARTGSGKNVIFAWFEDKKAAMAWYYSDMHQQMMDMLPRGDRQGRRPMEEVKTDSGPVLVIASITMSDTPHFEGVPFPISQIAIEVYQPVTGGIYLGSRFAPDGLKVPGSPARNAAGDVAEQQD